KTMFDNPDELMKKLLESAEVLKKWQETYFQVRKKIEDKKDERWEFDKDAVLERTQYIADRCMDLYEIAKVIARFKKFLGPELRGVTGDTKGIDEVLQRVKKLVVPIQEVKYNIFDKRGSKNWKEVVMKQFKEEVEDINQKTIEFIDKSFKKLRSAESAFKLLQDVKSIQSTDKDSIMEKM